jgi:UPF0176 protein
MTWTIAALYRFTALDALPALQAEVKAACAENGICGTLLLAPEGINGTIAGPEGGLRAMMAFLDRRLGVGKGEIKYSSAEQKPFKKAKVRLKREIVTLRQPQANPALAVGTYVEPRDWNALLDANPGMPVIDTRNTYETMVGMFEGAIDPKTKSFTEFPAFVNAHLDPAKHRKIAMYCTGGIRCEKASSYMLSQGFEEVYHLKGGILKYLEDIPQEQSRWNGECFVFDRRVAIGHGLKESPYSLCFGCRMPLSEEDASHPDYEEGVSCHHCKSTLSDEKAKALRMRHQQMQREKKTA